MLKIRRHKFIWFGIILLGVMLLRMPAVYAEDVKPMLEPSTDAANLDQYNLDADVSDPLPTLDDTDEDFVFTPVSPCRIIDTRKAGGAIGSNTSRSFRVWGYVSPQGGNSAGCPTPVGEPVAVLMNIVAVDSTAPGYLTVWPYGESRPQAGVLNYSPTDKTDPISNAFTVKTASGDPDIYVYAYKQTHVVADVMGYYSRPQSTQLQSYIYTATATISANGTGAATAYCYSPQYVATGGGCHVNVFDAGLHIVGNRPFDGGWRCDVLNATSSAQGINAHAVCTRVPGR